MIRLLIRAVIFLGSAALGLWITSLIVDGFDIKLSGYIIAVVIFTVVQLVLSPFILKMTRKYANALIGGVGIVATFVSLLITSIISDGLSIDGVTAWVLGTFIMWLVTAIASWLLPHLLLREGVQKVKANNDA